MFSAYLLKDHDLKTIINLLVLLLIETFCSHNVVTLYGWRDREKEVQC